MPVLMSSSAFTRRWSCFCTAQIWPTVASSDLMPAWKQLLCKLTCTRKDTFRGSIRFPHAVHLYYKGIHAPEELLTCPSSETTSHHVAAGRSWVRTLIRSNAPNIQPVNVEEPLVCLSMPTKLFATLP